MLGFSRRRGWSFNFVEVLRDMVVPVGFSRSTIIVLLVGLLMNLLAIMSLPSMGLMLLSLLLDPPLLIILSKRFMLMWCGSGHLLKRDLGKRSRGSEDQAQKNLTVRISLACEFLSPEKDSV